MTRMEDLEVGKWYAGKDDGRPAYLYVKEKTEKKVVILFIRYVPFYELLDVLHFSVKKEAMENDDMHKMDTDSAHEMIKYIFLAKTIYVEHEDED